MISLRIGTEASCTDGASGQVTRIIVNPVAREVTHLAVDPKHQQGRGRLVPVDLVDAATGQIRLRCSLAEFQALRAAQETEIVPDLDPTGHAGNASGQAKLPGWMPRRRDPGVSKAPRQVTVDYIPPDEVDIRRDLTVCATDDEIGQIRGLIVEPGGYQITHVLLQERHMRGGKEVAIPIGDVTKIGTLLIHLSLTKRQVKDLPPVDSGHTAGG